MTNLCKDNFVKSCKIFFPFKKGKLFFSWVVDMRLQILFYSTLCHFKTILENIIFSDTPQRL